MRQVILRDSRRSRWPEFRCFRMPSSAATHPPPASKVHTARGARSSATESDTPSSQTREAPSVRHDARCIPWRPVRVRCPLCLLFAAPAAGCPSVYTLVRRVSSGRSPESTRHPAPRHAPVPWPTAPPRPPAVRQAAVYRSAQSEGHPRSPGALHGDLTPLAPSRAFRSRIQPRPAVFHVQHPGMTGP